MPPRSHPTPFIKEWIFLLSALLTLGGFIGWSLFDEHRAIEQREREYLAVQANTIHDILGRQLDAISRALLSNRNELSRWKTLPDGMERANQRLIAFTDAMPGVRTMTILDAEGTAIAANRPELVGRNFRERDYFQNVLRQPDPDRLYIGPPFTTNLGVWAMNVVRMVPGPQGEFAGILSATLDPDEFKILLGSVNHEPDMWSALGHGDGKLFLMMPERPDLDGANLATPGSFFTRHRQSGQTATVMTGKVATTGEYRMMAQHSVQPPALNMDKPLVIAISRDIDAIYAEWRTELRSRGSLFALVALISMIGLALLQRRQRGAEEQIAASNAALAESEHFMRSLIDIIPGMVGYWNTDLRCSFANIAYREWFDKTPEQMRGIHVEELLGGEPFRKNEAFIRAALRGERQHFERTLTKADGTVGYSWAYYIPDIVDGQVRGFFVLVSDISELKQTELALREALARAERFREALDHVSSFIYMKDRNHCYVYANRPTLELFGVSAEELPGSPDSRFFPPEIVRQLKSIDERVFAGERTSEEIDVVAEGGQRRTYLEIKTPIYSDEEKREVWGLCGISTDISARKLTEEALERARSAAEAASQAKSAFVANMSHEIRTPMNAVLGLLQLLELTELDEQQIDYARKAKIAAQSLLAILNDILDFSKVEAGKMTLDASPFRPNDLLRNLSVMLSAAQQNKEVAVRYQLDPDIPRDLLGDGMRLQQILLNLAGNAIKFTAQGEVVVDLHLRELRPAAARIDFSVRDTGIGIAADRLEAIFEGFTQAETSTTRRFGGTGLGLAISQRLVRMMGGELAVDSTPGQGSRFYFTLDFARDMEALAVENVPLPHAGATGRQPLAGLRILLVEDNPLNQIVVKELLVHAGALVEVAGNGRKCVDRFANGDAPVDLILMDIQMPEMDGYAATRILRKDLGIRLPIVAMTANVLPADRDACLDAGMDDHIGKPIDIVQLIATILKYCQPAPSAAPSGPAAENASSAPDLSPLPEGFDIDAALARLDHNRELYARLVADFAHDHGDLPERISRLWRDGDIEAAARELHTLKGLAASLGALALSAAAAKAEAKLKTQAASDAIEPLLTPLREPLAAALRVLREIAATLAPARDEPAAEPMDAVYLVKRLHEFEGLLADNNLRALTIHELLKQEAGTLASEEFQALNAAIRRLDFVAAREIAARIRTQLAN